MEKMKLLSVFLLCLAITGIAVAKYSVINVDINGWEDTNFYNGGYGAYDGPGGNYWVVYYGGWAIAVGSEGTAHLSNEKYQESQADDPNFTSIYEAQVWLGTSGEDVNSFGGGDPNNPGLMDDGFEAMGPNAAIEIFGRNAYRGNFDIYVYGATDGNFTMEWEGSGGEITKSVTGGYTGTFVEGQNYVIFEDVNVFSTDPNTRTRLGFTGQLNALQLVKRKAQSAYQLEYPTDQGHGDPNVFFIPAVPWDRAGDYNNRAEGGGDTEDNIYGPTVLNWPDDANYPFYQGMPTITSFNWWEFAEYDVEILEAAQYSISPVISVRETNFDVLGITVNGKVVGRALGTLAQDNAPAEPIPANRVLVNLYPGEYRIGWRILRLMGSVNTGYSILGLNVRQVDDVQVDDCLDVLSGGFNHLGDLNRDCVVDEDDLAEFVGQWLGGNDPN
ncbi:MAG: hypothetical protein WCZ89_07590 [Phycisphaerae bacterium]